MYIILSVSSTFIFKISIHLFTVVKHSVGINIQSCNTWKQLIYRRRFMKEIEYNRFQATEIKNGYNTILKNLLPFSWHISNVKKRFIPLFQWFTLWNCIFHNKLDQIEWKQFIDQLIQWCLCFIQNYKLYAWYTNFDIQKITVKWKKKKVFSPN